MIKTVNLSAHTNTANGCQSSRWASVPDQTIQCLKPIWTVDVRYRQNVQKMIYLFKGGSTSTDTACMSKRNTDAKCLL